MEIKNLVSFKAILEEGSFGNAANKLGYSQSTITFQMKQLEEDLGIQLFEKIGRRMVLTKEGKDVIPYIDKTLLALENLQNAGKKISELQGELNIVMSETLLCYRTQKVITEFRELAPNVKIKLRSMSCYAARQALQQGSADLGVFYNLGQKEDRLTVHSLGHVSLSVIASPQQEERDFCTPNQQLRTSFINDEPDGLFRQQFEQYVREKHIVMGNTIELWSIATIKNMVMSNLGVSYLPTFTVEQELKAGQLIELSSEMNDDKLQAIYAYHKNKSVNRQMSLFIQLIEEYMRFDTINSGIK